MILSPLITALRTLTIITIPGRDVREYPRALLFFPVVGALIGTLCGGVAYGALWCGANYLFTAFLVTVLSIVITGALHLDGLADVADGFGGGGNDAGRILAIMKDTHHGTFGVVAIVLDCAARIVLIFCCLEKGLLMLVVLAPLFSRTVMAWGCVLLPNARSGEGTAAPFFGESMPSGLYIVTALMAIGLIFSPWGMPIVTVPLVALIPAQLFFLWCQKKIGGMTGDCLGAVNEIAEGAFCATGYLLSGVLFAG